MFLKSKMLFFIKGVLPSPNEITFFFLSKGNKLIHVFNVLFEKLYLKLEKISVG